MESKNKLYTAPYESELIDYLLDTGFNHNEDQEGEINSPSSLHIIINRPDRQFWIVDSETLEVQKSNAEDEMEKIKSTTLKEIASWLK